jgi:hypothetical protein
MLAPKKHVARESWSYWNAWEAAVDRKAREMFAEVLGSTVIYI